jgi:hypothetical protein
MRTEWISIEPVPIPRKPAAIGFAALSAVAGAVLGQTYISRLPNHAGYFLVPVEDEIRAPLPPRPRHAVFILVDGLRRASAETMASARMLASAGQCRVSDQGGYTVSRPVYALLSTGLEVDRSGARNNDLTAPLGAESVWQVARESGLHVTGSSHLPWFRQLFPAGFDSFRVMDAHERDVFADADLTDVNLFHPLYVDAAGHEYGGASPEYARAVARADAEIGRLLAKLDLEQDLVVLTADHGHRDEGGHGGGQPEINDVLTCFAGRNVAKLDGRRRFDGRVTGPALALLLGLHFPRQMRAGDDGLDALWEIANVDAPYIADRRAAVARFRDQNRSALAGWLGSEPGTWPRFYEQEAQKQRLRLAAAALGSLLLLGLRLRAQRSLPRALETLGLLAAAATTLYGAHHVALGDFDYTSINGRERFVTRALLASLASAVVSVGAHAAVVRDRERLTADGLTVVGVLLAANLGHIVVYGWPLGFPLPSPAERYAPFFGAIALVGWAVVTLVLALLRRRAPAPAPPSTDR